MTTSPFSGKRTHVAAIIYRTGNEVTIKRDDGTASENRYGKVSDNDRTFSTVDTEYARRLYNSRGNRDSQQIVEGGRLDEDTPRIAFKHDTAAQENDHVTFPSGQTYSLDKKSQRDTHTEFRATLLQN